ncbi:MAG: AsmA family protein, partial [Candidatus Binatia bacterium]
ELANLRRFAPLAGSLPPDLSANGPLSLEAHVEGTTENLALTATLEATASAISLGESLHKPEGIPLLLSTDARITKKAVALQKAKIQLHTLELTSSGEVGLGKVPSLRLTLDSNRAALAGWEKLIPLPQNADLSGNLEVHAKVQGEMGNGKMPKIDGTLTLAGVNATLPSVPKPLTDLNAKVTFTGSRAELTETTVRLGESQIRLAAEVERFSPLALTYRLSAPELRLADLQTQTDGSAGQIPEVLKEVKSEGRIGMENGSLSYQGQLSSGQGTISQVAYTDLKTTASLAGQVATIESLTTQAFGGTLKASGRYDMREAAPRFTFASQVQNLDLTQVFNSALVTAPQDVQGRFNFDLQLNGSGKEWQEIQQTLQGQGRVEVVDGTLRNINVAEGVLSGVTGLPGLSLLVSPRIRESYPEIFATGDTKFDQLGGSVTIGGGKVQTDDLVIAAADWKAQGKGWFSFDRTLDFRAHLVMSQKLSDDIVDEVKQVKYILEQGRLVIPFALAGALPGVKPKPDVQYVGELLKQAVVRRGTEELQKRVLDKFLPRREPPLGEGEPTEPEQQAEGQPAEPGQQPEDQPAEPEPPRRSLEEELLRKGIEGLFGR